MADKVKNTSNKPAGDKTPAVKKDTKAPEVIICNELIFDRSEYEGLKPGYYNLGFEPVQRWAKYNSTHKGQLLARQVQISKTEFDKGKRT